MSEQKKLEQARKVFNTICTFLDGEDWPYTKNEEKFSVDCSAKGDDLPIDIRIVINPEFERIMLISFLSPIVPEDKRVDVSIVISFINKMFINGCFDFDIKTGEIYFRMSQCYMDCLLGEEVFEYMIYCACSTIDEYNDQLLMLSKGMITVEQFISKNNN